MALLPYQSYLVHDPAVVKWCQQQWPWSCGATWNWHYCGQRIIKPQYRPPSGQFDLYVDRWSFQFVEDHTLFLLTWSDLRVELVD